MRSIINVIAPQRFDFINREQEAVLIALKMADLLCSNSGHLHESLCDFNLTIIHHLRQEVLCSIEQEVVVLLDEDEEPLLAIKE